MVGGGTSELVDFMTTSKELEDIMIGEFPGIITEKQHKVDKSDPKLKLYWFYSLPKKLLVEFLEKYKTKYIYKVCNDVSEINLVEFSESDLN